MENDLVVKKLITISADSAKVWDAITNSELTKKYMYNSVIDSTWRKGSSIIWKDADSGKIHVKGKILQIEPEKILVTSDLSIDANLPDITSNYTTVKYELNSKNDKTILSVTEENFNGNIKRFKDAEQFWEKVLTGLKNLFE